MSRLAELIEELCPDGVEYRPLGELLAYQQPTPFLVSSKDYDPSYPTPVLTAGATFLLGYSSETHGVYPASTDDPVIIFDDFTTASKWVDFPFKLKSSAAKILTAADSNVADIRFLYFLMQTLITKLARMLGIGLLSIQRCPYAVLRWKYSERS